MKKYSQPIINEQLSNQYLPIIIAKKTTPRRVISFYTDGLVLMSLKVFLWRDFVSCKEAEGLSSCFVSDRDFWVLSAEDYEVVSKSAGDSRHLRTIWQKTLII